MLLVLPELASPLQALTACVAVPLDKYPDERSFFPQEKNMMIARSEDERYFVRLVRDQFNPAVPNYGHFHLDIASPSAFATIPSANSYIHDVLGHLRLILDKLLEVKFESKFEIKRTDVVKSSLLGMWSTVRLQAPGTQTSLSAGSIQIADTVFRELRWKPLNASAQSPFIIDILGSLGPQAISVNLFEIIKSRAEFGFDRFVKSATTKPARN